MAVKDGDIFDWRYTDKVLAAHNKHWHGMNPYHCRSMRAVFRDGGLKDTFWGTSSSDSYLDKSRIVLTYLGNENEMTKISPGERAFYRPEDIVDMNHSNNSRAPVYVKVGAKRDRQAMQEYFAYKVQRFTSDIEFTKRKIEDCQSALASIERGELDGHFPIWESSP